MSKRALMDVSLFILFGLVRYVLQSYCKRGIEHSHHHLVNNVEQSQSLSLTSKVKVFAVRSYGISQKPFSTDSRNTKLLQQLQRTC